MRTYIIGLKIVVILLLLIIQIPYAKSGSDYHLKYCLIPQDSVIAKNDTINIPYDEYMLNVLGLDKGLFYKKESARKDTIIKYQDTIINRCERENKNLITLLNQKPSVIRETNWFATMLAVVVATVVYLAVYISVNNLTTK